MIRRTGIVLAGLLALAGAWVQGLTNMQPQGWAVRAALTSGRPLYNTAKQKLLDGKQIFRTVITRRDPDLY